jgi:hypothetical protein
MSTTLTPEEVANGFIRPMRTRVEHTFCKTASILRTADALDMARDPKSWSSCYCFVCGRRRPASEFTWFPDGEPVGS